MRSGVRIQQAILDGLQADDGGDAKDVVRVRPARNLRRRHVQAEENLAVGIGTGDVLDKLAGDVAGVQVGEDKDVRATGDGVFRKLP